MTFWLVCSWMLCALSLSHIFWLGSHLSFSSSSQWWPASSFHTWGARQSDAGGLCGPRRKPGFLPLPQPPRPSPHGPESQRWTDQRRCSQSLPAFSLPLGQQHQSHTLFPISLFQPRLFLLLQRNGTQPAVSGRGQDWVTVPRPNRRGGRRKQEPRLSHQSYLFLSLVLFFRFLLTMALSLFLSQSFDAKNTQNERGETEREVKEGIRGERLKPKIFIYPNRWKGGNVGPFC